MPGRYPNRSEIDAWCEGLLARARAQRIDVRPVDATSYRYELGVRHIGCAGYLAFDRGDRTFYGYWQPSTRSRAPLLIHVPTYAGEISSHPEFVIEGFHVLHVNPLGYYTPHGPAVGVQIGSVLPDTIASAGERGYVDWLEDAAIGALWALGRDDVDPTRFGFFGESQGGGGALLLASIFSDEGVGAVAADVPFLTDFRGRAVRYAALPYGLDTGHGKDSETPEGWRALGFIDTISHAHRLKAPVLLTAGDIDGVCPAETIRALADALPGTKCLTVLSRQDHACTVQFVPLARAWFGLYV